MRPSLSFFVCALMLLSAVTAGAQTARPERPYRGLFGGGAADEPEERLLLTVAVGGGYDDLVFAATGLGSNAPGWESGAFGRLTGALEYALNTERGSFGASVATDSRYVPGLPTEYLGAQSGSVGAAIQLGRNTRVSGNQAVSYQPFLTLDLFPNLFDLGVGQAQPAAQERATPFEEYLIYQTAVNFTQRVTRRGSLEFMYARELNDVVGADRDLRIQTGSGRYKHEIARGLGVRLGYGRSVGQYFDPSGPRNVGSHLIDAGLDFNRALSFSRRTTVSFATGSSAVTDLAATRYLVTGDARLNHEMGRTWNAAFAYARNVAFVKTFNEPFLSDAISAGVSGLVTRRLEFELGAAASFGDVGIATAANRGFTTYSASSALTFGLTRHLALAASYAYYRYTFDAGVSLPTGLAQQMDRQSVQAVLSMWRPLFERQRRANASR